MNFHFNWIYIPLSWRASPSYRVNTLGPLCLWQCLRPNPTPRHGQNCLYVLKVGWFSCLVKKVTPKYRTTLINLTLETYLSFFMAFYTCWPNVISCSRKLSILKFSPSPLPSPSSPRLIVSIIQKSLMESFGSFNNGCKYVWGFASVPYFWLSPDSSIGSLVTHSVTHWLQIIVEKHYQRALWETCDPWDMLSEWFTFGELWYLIM